MEKKILSENIAGMNKLRDFRVAISLMSMLKL